MPTPLPENPDPAASTGSPPAAPDRIELIEARVVDLVIRLILLGLFAYLSLALIRPFLAITTWAVILAVALAPVHDWLTRLLQGHRRLAAMIVTLAALCVVIGPVAALTSNMVESVQSLVERANSGQLKLPPPPARLETLPLVGQQIHDFWTSARANLESVVLSYHRILAPIGAKMIALVSQLGLDLLKFVLSIVLAGLLLIPGPRLAGWGRRIAARIVAPRGEQFVDLATVTVRNVSRGVVGIALLQGILIGVVLQAAGVPSAGLLALIILFLCILQIGPALIVLPVLIWSWLTMTPAQALLLTVVLVPLTFMDNVLKPMLMGRGLSTPTLVIFMGVIGGTLSFGLIGLFLGPVVLAVFHDLVLTWLQHDPHHPVEKS
ncbi:AI-2E family transporter [Paracoccus sp. KR1-242]|uniref:AI-2E family transporter n=1 Tax=Paracoccus sp. KR1-242 TaxID=3410028 RepID=UPI003BFD8021